MSVIEHLASVQGRRDEQPNIDLAIQLAAEQDTQGLEQIVDALWSKDKKVRNDCVKVLYEVGYRQPKLVSPYAEDFVELLKEKNNRLVWGGMIALSTVADLEPDVVYAHLALIQRTFEAGSVITRDAGVRVMAKIAAHSEPYNREIFPYLLEHLRTCRPKDVPQHAESALVAVSPQNAADFLQVLADRKTHLNATQLNRIEKIEKQIA
jgi:HEAT repeat protein